VLSVSFFQPWQDAANIEEHNDLSLTKIFGALGVCSFLSNRLLLLSYPNPAKNVF